MTVKSWNPTWTGWTMVSEDRYIAEKDQLAVFAGRVFKTKEAAIAFYHPKSGQHIVEIGVRP
jgi:hypothetical protein